jgi:hypothetical protein
MSNFLISVDRNPITGEYIASFFEGQNILLKASNYHDAVLEADMLEPHQYEVGYN